MTHQEQRSGWAWLFRLLRPHIRSYVLGSALAVGGGLSAIVDPLAIKWLVDSALPTRRFDWAVEAVLLFLVGNGTRMLTGAVSSLIIFKSSQRAALKLRIALLRRITALSLEFHSSVGPGETLFRVERDVEQVVEGGSNTITHLVTFLSSAAISGVLVLYLNPVLATAIIPISAVFFALRQRFKRRLQENSEQVQQAASAASALVQEHLGAVPQVQLLRCERTQMLRLAAGLAGRLRAESARRISELIFASASSSMIMISTGAILAIGSVQVSQGKMTIGGLLACYTLLGRLFDPVGVVAGLCTQFSRIATSIRRLREILECRSTVQELSDAVAVCRPVFLDLRNVSFQYGEGKNVLNGVTLHIEPGEMLGLAGRSGCGKTTLARLIPRLQDPTAGQVMLNGRDIRHYRLHSLRSAIAYVHQEPVLFNRTVRENLLIASPLASEERLWDVLRAVRLDGLVASLATALETQLGPMGARLSGGERQRLIIARTLLINPSILILDEATAGIDQRTEREVLRAIRSHFPEMAVILISHRRSSLELTDRVLVLYDGCIQRDGRAESVLDAHYDDINCAVAPLM